MVPHSCARENQTGRRPGADQRQASFSNVCSDVESGGALPAGPRNFDSVSGGRTIGKKVAEELGIPCYDSELIQQVAEINENYVKDASEYSPAASSRPPYRTEHPAPTTRIIFGGPNTRS